MKAIIFLLLPILFFGSDLIKKYNTGQTFEFAENDMLLDIQNNIANNKTDISKKLSDYKKIAKDKVNKYKPSDLKELTPALKNNIFYPDMRYTNPDNIYDNNGNVIYPKGFTFNPLDYQTLHQQIIVINGEARDEIDWLIKNNYTDSIKYMILLSNGNYKSIGELLNQPVFYAIPAITDKFKLKHTPSIITQKGNKIEVKEICLSCKKDTK